MKTLVIYATKYGTTKTCTDKLVGKLSGTVEVVDIGKNKAPSLEAFDTVVIGGPVKIGKIHAKIKRYCVANTEELLQKKIGLFICCMAEGEDAKKELDANFPQALLDKAVVRACFGGEFLMSRMGFFTKKMIQGIAKTDKDVSAIKESEIEAFAKVINA